MNIIDIFIILLCIIVYYALIFLFNYLVFRPISKNKEKCILKVIKKNFLGCILNFISIFISPDYALTYIFKEAIKHQNGKKKAPKILANYIKEKNKWNIVISTIIILLLSCYYLRNCTFIHYLLYTRLISRTMEINISFLQDVFDKNKSSALHKYDRIKLAFGSLVEEAVMFFEIYVITSITFENSILYALHSFIIQPANLKEIENFFYKLIPIYQTICSIILITISFALPFCLNIFSTK